MGDIHIELKNVPLVKVVVEGDVNCPDCGLPLNVGVLGFSYLLMYCPSCRCHWMPEIYREQHEKLIDFSLQDKRTTSNILGTKKRE